MAIVSVQEDWKGRAGVFEINAEDTVTRTFVVTTDGDTADRPPLVAASFLLPTHGTLEPSGLTAARLKRKRVTQDPANKTVYRVVCEYDSKTEEEEDDNPLLRPLVVTGSFATYTKEIDVDKDGKAIVNTLDKPLIAEQEDNRLELVVVRSVATVNVDLLAEYTNAINSQEFQFADKLQTYLIGPRQALLASAPFRPVTVSGVAFYEVTMSFQVNTEEWNPRKFMNQGLEYRDKTKITAAEPKGIIINTRAGDGQISNSPVLLNADGQLLPKDEDVIFIESNTYQEQPFTRLFE